MPKQNTGNNKDTKAKTKTKARPPKTPVKVPKAAIPAPELITPEPGRAQALKNALKKAAISPVFAKWYALFALVTLLATTVFWALQSSVLQLSNADQLVNPYLFENSNTFRQTLFPGAHSFLLKWPLFWLIKHLGYTTSTYMSVTVGVVLLAVGGLAFIMYKIERRPLILGTLFLALASTLLMVPAQPYAGGLLPVNMAMLSTDNLEYVLYVISLFLLIRARRMRNWKFWAAAACLSLLIASDKLFLAFSVGGAILALTAYTLIRGWKMAGLSARWLVASLAAGVAALGLFWSIQAHHITHIVGQTASSPYDVVQSANGVKLGALYGVLGLFTNFGANPVYDVTIVRNIPHQLFVRLLRPDGIAFVVNGIILFFGLYLAWRVLYYTLIHHRRDNIRLNTSTTLSVLLIWASLAAMLIFVATNHYYAVDARYLAITLFAVFISSAVAISQRPWESRKVFLAGLVIFVSILAGLLSANHRFDEQRAALSTINSRNTSIAQALVNRQSDVLVGDYWRVFPIKFIARNRINVMPLDSCTQPRDALSSMAWRPDLKKHGFVYLLSIDASPTDYKHCGLNQVLAAYGRPNASTLIAGTLSKPKELLLFYDNGINKSTPLVKPLPLGPSTIVPITLSQIPSSTCKSPTVMNVVAHQDDDLLFMNPDIIHYIKAGYCIRTVYVTAGDSGNGEFYWLGREQGSEAAYSNMLGIEDSWIARIVKLSDHEYVTVASPIANPNVSLVFMHLPDGSPKGTGFEATNFESLQRLEHGQITKINGVDGQSSYTSDQLTGALTGFMYLFQPTVINTQYSSTSQKYIDHSDHEATGRYVQRSYLLYETQQFQNTVTIPIHFYMGYPIRQKPANVFGNDADAKEAAFFAYAMFDAPVCDSLQTCNDGSTYTSYLTRQYQGQ